MKKQPFVEQARRLFDQELQKDEYRKLIVDGFHLSALMNFLHVQPNKLY